MKYKIIFILEYVFTKFKFILGFDKFYYLDRKVVEVNDYIELKKIFKWKNLPYLDRDDLDIYEFTEDVNSRRRRDAEAIATVVCNVKPKIALEIGTADGGGTALIAANTKKGLVYTVNIPPEDIDNGEGGILITKKFSVDEIGEKYRKKGFKNIKQIFANTAYWEPNIGKIDVAFIDGCHDTSFVINDTIKILKNMEKGSFVLWHDFNPKLVKRHHWINDVCQGVEELFRRRYISGNIYYIKDSWVGIYRV